MSFASDCDVSARYDFGGLSILHHTIPEWLKEFTDDAASTGLSSDGHAESPVFSSDEEPSTTKTDNGNGMSKPSDLDEVLRWGHPFWPSSTTSAAQRFTRPSEQDAMTSEPDDAEWPHYDLTVGLFDEPDTVSPKCDTEVELVDLDEEEGRRRGQELMALLRLDPIVEEERPAFRLTSSAAPFVPQASLVEVDNGVAGFPSHMTSTCGVEHSSDMTAPDYVEGHSHWYRSCQRSSTSNGTEACWDYAWTGLCPRGPFCRWSHAPMHSCQEAGSIPARYDHIEPTSPLFRKSTRYEHTSWK